MKALAVSSRLQLIQFKVIRPVALSKLKRVFSSVSATCDECESADVTRGHLFFPGPALSSQPFGLKGPLSFITDSWFLTVSWWYRAAPSTHWLVPLLYKKTSYFWWGHWKTGHFKRVEVSFSSLLHKASKWRGFLTPTPGLISFVALLLWGRAHKPGTDPVLVCFVLIRSCSHTLGFCYPSLQWVENQSHRSDEFEYRPVVPFSILFYHQKLYKWNV